MTATKRHAFGRATANWNSVALDAYLELYDDGIKLHGYSDR